MKQNNYNKIINNNNYYFDIIIKNIINKYDFDRQMINK